MQKRLGINLFLVLLILTLAVCKKDHNPLSQPYMSPYKNLSDDFFSLNFISSMEGYVEPCGCTKNPLGGVARLTTVLDHIKNISKKRSLLIDTGNLLFESQKRNEVDKCQDGARIELLLHTLAQQNLAFTFSGSNDFAHGSKFSDDLLNKYHIKKLAPLTSHVVDKMGYKLVFIGINDPKTTIIDIKKALDKFKKDQNIKAIVAISQLDEELTNKIFFNTKLVDIVIKAKLEAHIPNTPRRIGDDGPVLVEGSKQGQYFTVLILQNLKQRKNEILKLDQRSFLRESRQKLLETRVLALEKQLLTSKDKKDFLSKRLAMSKKSLKEIKQEKIPPLSEPSILFHSIALTKKIKPESKIKKKLNEYTTNIPLLVKKCEQNITCPKVKKGEASYVGANACKACHTQAFDVWKNAVFQLEGVDEDGNKIIRSTGHSKAWQTLVDMGKDTDRTCIGCHSIGFMEKGGYCKAFEVDFRKDVQCESCHGPGSLHAQSGDKKFIKRQVSENTCRGCHHVPHIESYDSFNYEQKLIKVLGKGHGENLLKKLTHELKK